MKKLKSESEKIQSEIKNLQNRLALLELIKNLNYIDIKNNLLEDIRAFYIESTLEEREYVIVFKLNNEVKQFSIKVPAKELFSPNLKKMICTSLLDKILNSFNFM